MAVIIFQCGQAEIIFFPMPTVDTSDVHKNTLCRRSVKKRRQMTRHRPLSPDLPDIYSRSNAQVVLKTQRSQLTARLSSQWTTMVQNHKILHDRRCPVCALF